MDEFWKQAANDGNLWLKKLCDKELGYEYLPGVKGSQKNYHVDSVDLNLFKGSLPSEMKLQKFSDDPYRGILYFCRGIGWDKDNVSSKAANLPFPEFYWAEQIQTAIENGETELHLHTKNSIYDLSDLGDYTEAVRAISLWMSKLKSSTPIGSRGFTAKQMGQIPFDSDEFAKLIDASGTKGGKPDKTIDPKDSDKPGAKQIGKLPKPGKWAWARAEQYGAPPLKRAFTRVLQASPPR